jgi:hypothetical protein
MEDDASLLDGMVSESESDEDLAVAPPPPPHQRRRPATHAPRPAAGAGPAAPRSAAASRSTASAAWPRGKQSTLAPHREKFSNLRVKNRVVSAAAMEVQMRGRKMIKIAQLLHVSRARLEDETLDWVTIGVLGEKSKVRLDKKGGKFMTWRLTDLEAHSVTLFLFKGAYEAHRQCDAGDVFALINPRVLPALEGSSKGMALSVSEGVHVVRLGRAMDFGRCRSMRRDGRACLAPINVLHGAFCDFHATAKKKSIGSKRPALAGDGSRGALLRMLARPAMGGKKRPAQAARGIIGVNTRQHRDLSGNATYALGRGKQAERIAIGGIRPANSRSSVAQGMAWRQGLDGRRTTAAAAAATQRLGATVGKRSMSKGELMLQRALGATKALARQSAAPAARSAVPQFRTSAIAQARGARTAERAFGAPRGASAPAASASAAARPTKRRKTSAAPPGRDRLACLLDGNGAVPKRSQGAAAARASVRAVGGVTKARAASAASARPPVAPPRVCAAKAPAAGDGAESWEMQQRKEAARMRRRDYIARQEASHQREINPAEREALRKAKHAAAAAFLQRKQSVADAAAKRFGSSASSSGVKRTPQRPMSAHFAKSPGVGSKRGFAQSFNGALPTADSKEGRDLIASASLNAEALQVDKDERLTCRLGSRAQRERVAERLSELTELKVTVFSCLQVCAALASSRGRRRRAACAAARSKLVSFAHHPRPSPSFAPTLAHHIHTVRRRVEREETGSVHRGRP